ncbi:hypothetical protein [Acinetobacter venetianus]|uniref:hypothetical protein n=1 Tax=Acinetobacter venetianus TaxID=52133 RepID=UPI00037A6F13|nr:hypothetical protein [Acinetobacter venetianus]
MSNLEYAINTFTPRPEQDVQSFLDQFPASVQLQFVSALYHGRTHIQHTKFTTDEDPRTIGTTNADHISSNEYARLIWEKGDNVIVYLNKFRECANNSNFDINTL